MKIGEITAHSGWSLPPSEFALTDISFARALVDSGLSIHFELGISYFEVSVFQAVETQNLKILPQNDKWSRNYL